MEKLKEFKKEMLSSLKCESEHDLKYLNEFYYPKTELPMPSMMNSCSRRNLMFQRVLKKRIQLYKKVIEVGCGSGGFTIPLANEFPKIKFIAVEPTSAILYTILKRDIHNFAKDRQEYLDIIKNYIPQRYIEHDDENHPQKFGRINNLTFVPSDSFDLDTNIKGDFTFCGFVANNYYHATHFTGDLHKFVNSIRRLSEECVLIDGNFDFGMGSSISQLTIDSLCRDFNLEFRMIEKVWKCDYFLLWHRPAHSNFLKRIFKRAGQIFSKN
jgi:SAM-dependent methyltransferase